MNNIKTKYLMSITNCNGKLYSIYIYNQNENKIIDAMKSNFMTEEYIWKIYYDKFGRETKIETLYPHKFIERTFDYSKPNIVKETSHNMNGKEKLNRDYSKKYWNSQLYDPNLKNKKIFKEENNTLIYYDKFGRKKIIIMVDEKEKKVDILDIKYIEIDEINEKEIIDEIVKNSTELPILFMKE